MRATREALVAGIEQVRGRATASATSRPRSRSASSATASPWSATSSATASAKRLHEEPQVPNFGQRDRGVRLREGMVLAIEPMVNAGGPEVVIKDDGWTAVTRDGSRSAHFEHSVAVTANGPVRAESAVEAKSEERSERESASISQSRVQEVQGGPPRGRRAGVVQQPAAQAAPRVSRRHGARTMARIAGVDLPRNKRMEVALTYIFGIGRSSARKILNEAGIRWTRRATPSATTSWSRSASSSMRSSRSKASAP